MMKTEFAGVFGLASFFAVIISSFVCAGELEMTSVKAEWTFFSDQVMGGRSDGDAQLLTDQKKQFVRLEGNVTTENNGGFIQIRTAVFGLNKDLKGVSLQARGNGEKYYIFIRTSGTILPWQYYKADFLPKKYWSRVDLEFRDFLRSSPWLGKKFRPESIKSIGVVAYGRDHRALIDVAALNFF